MKKVTVETIRKEANVQIIPVNASLICKTITALNRCDFTLCTLEQVDPDSADLFKKEVGDFLREMRDAFFELDKE